MLLDSEALPHQGLVNIPCWTRVIPLVKMIVFVILSEQYTGKSKRGLSIRKYIIAFEQLLQKIRERLTTKYSHLG